MEKNNKIIDKYIDAFKGNDTLGKGGVLYNCIKIIEGEFPYTTSSSFDIDEVKVDLETRRIEQIAELRKEAAEWWRVLGFGNTFFTEPLLGDDSKSSLISEIENEIELHSFTDKYVARCIKKILTPLTPLFDIYVGVVTNKKIRPLLDVNISDIDLDEIIVEGGYYFGFEHKKDFTPEDFIVTTWYELLNFIEELDTLLTECDFDLVEIAKSSNITLHLPHRNIQTQQKGVIQELYFKDLLNCGSQESEKIEEAIKNLGEIKPKCIAAIIRILQNEEYLTIRINDDEDEGIKRSEIWRAWVLSFGGDQNRIGRGAGRYFNPKGEVSIEKSVITKYARLLFP